MLQIGATNTFRYDANGNLVAGNGRSLSWTPDNLVASVTGPDGVVETYGYDPDGERVVKKRAGVTTIYLEGIWEEEIERGVSRQIYTFRGDEVAQRTKSATQNELIYLHADHLGSVSATTNAQGQPVEHQLYDPWGRIRAGELTQTTLDYTGQRRDDTGLLYYHARYYDPLTARFLSADSIVPDVEATVVSIDSDVAFAPLTVDFHGPKFIARLTKEHAALDEHGFFERTAKSVGPQNPQALNRYSYVFNNPLRYTDPTGHWPKWRPIRWYYGIPSKITQSVVRNGIRLYTWPARHWARWLSSSSGARAVMGSPFNPPRLYNARTWQEAQRWLGQRGLTPNTQDHFVRGMTRARRPDFVNINQGYIADSKWVKRLTITPQLRDFATLARARNVRLDIYVRQNTKVSAEALRLIQSTGGNVYRVFQ